MRSGSKSCAPYSFDFYGCMFYNDAFGRRCILNCIEHFYDNIEKMYKLILGSQNISHDHFSILAKSL